MIEFLGDNMSPAAFPLALFTDRYSFTMAQAFQESGQHERPAAFHLFFRQHPFKGAGYSIAGGLDYVIDWIKRLSFPAPVLNYMARQVGNDGRPLFKDKFLGLLQNFRFQCDLDGIREGRVVGPHAPLIRGYGPTWQLTLIEGAILNFISRQSSVMTRGVRIVNVANGEPVMDMSLRRAPGLDGSLSDTLAVYKAGFSATSNELAGYLFDMPVKGTMAHCYVSFSPQELEALRSYAKAFPNNSLFLVDTFDTLEGVKLAIIVAKELEKLGHRAIGIRLDSGDLAWLSKEARKLLDDAGLQYMKIFGTNALNEFKIESIKNQGGKINVWGVGEEISACPPFGGVWKLGAVREDDGTLRRIAKLSQVMGKTTNPGLLGVRRFIDPKTGRFQADCIYDTELGCPTGEFTMFNPNDMYSQKLIKADWQPEEIVEPVFRGASAKMDPEPIPVVQKRCMTELAGLDEAVKRLDQGHLYPVGLAPDVMGLRTDMVFEHKKLKWPPLRSVKKS